MLAHYDDGHGDALYFGGSFTVAGNVAARSIARFDGTTWSALGSGISGQVVELCTFDDGTGEQLYVGGFFSSIGALAVPGIARWNGAQWSALPGQSPLSVNDYVTAMVVFDDGSGSALYLAGHMNMPALNSRNVVRWRNGTWSALGAEWTPSSTRSPCTTTDRGRSSTPRATRRRSATPTHSALGRIGLVERGRRHRRHGAWCEVNALVSFDDGSGPALYAGGSFASAGGVPASNIARLQNGTWSPLGAGTNAAVGTLAIFDDGTGNGPALHAGGSFIFAGGMPHFGIARWDGTAWSGLSAAS